MKDEFAVGCPCVHTRVTPVSLKLLPCPLFTLLFSSWSLGITPETTKQVCKGTCPYKDRAHDLESRWLPVCGLVPMDTWKRTQGIWGWSVHKNIHPVLPWIFSVPSKRKNKSQKTQKPRESELQLDWSRAAKCWNKTLMDSLELLQLLTLVPLTIRHVQLQKEKHTHANFCAIISPFKQES